MERFARQIENLLKAADLPWQNYETLALPGGWNNRVFRLETQAGPYLLKQYFPAAEGGFPKLAQEFAFSAYLEQQYPGHSPKPYAQDREVGLAIFEWIEGHAYQAGQVTLADAQAALDFILGIQSASPEALSLPSAAERCFCLSDHLLHLQKRLERLHTIVASESAEHELARHWFQTALFPQAQAVIASLETELRIHPHFNRALLPEEACLSPSDFGFHNALRTPRGPVFLDFEYAGWDDPAQLLCDFYAQFEVPAPAETRQTFATALAARSNCPDWHRQRFALIEPVHLLKWACIALNHFCPHKGDHRAFSQKVTAEQRQFQLLKAERVLQKLKGPV
ncbi:hypothetical protein COW36_02945 [bacterium (Candidatus Blackallbacteria) CG17_big_fil_post_rev_8_21_14_2_50_48_46]|uniref:Aminoglycoside phosphotransferase domain-containing protein n=1 Tax=bacterium (Candidatus Blackallbacteria) CG17_big_fil_post_rev_8_21_14_2_50_48_46 TaxID=2014261 RepID=A0A2M7GAB6_9BACT|nr:MAG: hypothetical protein COW64_12530 [bacterium (Candidatus Blackallbacteria) CG18_big_fil_WC_8_21_14_2_50_49_26]PIW19085.1 MAG: hypothetical protein COW36_02945 [bacterium (Candidatus Blackallbacteria) CG17_big_fil_post_rev_8_21_14_2_50_48_46]PIW44548.1 MAG: hypothetical protein COW20_23175 [bacterium (Candidatus Blackallbacteria) CG13_big_fil_rev_8_21_14_2_50_49_14]